jgi:ribose transport system permease protein
VSGDNTLLQEVGGVPVEPPTDADAALKGERRSAWWRKQAGNYGVLVAFVLMIIGFSIALPNSFATVTNFQQILGSQAIPGIVALAVLLPLTAGEFDLSVGATVGFGSVLAAHWATDISPLPLFLLVVLVGLCIGSVNAFLVRLGVNPFIATLGISTILSGGNQFVTKNITLFQGVSETISPITQTKVLGIALPFYYFIGLAIVLYYLLEWTPFGRYMRATGMGRDAARLTGVRTERWLALSFVVAGGIAAAAGFLQTSWVASANPTVGAEFLLPAYAAAFLGTTTIVRGFFNVWGTVVGVFLLAVGTTGLALGGAPFWVSPIFNGGALVIAVTLAVLSGRGRRGKV